MAKSNGQIVESGSCMRANLLKKKTKLPVLNEHIWNMSDNDSLMTFFELQHLCQSIVFTGFFFYFSLHPNIVEKHDPNTTIIKGRVGRK